MYTADQVEQVCRLIEDEGYPTRKALDLCEMSPGQFYRTIEANPELAERYARAKERHTELLESELIQIADGAECAVDDAIKVARDRLSVDTRKWLMSKLLPKKYGDRLSVDVSKESDADLLAEAAGIVRSREIGTTGDSQAGA